MLTQVDCTILYYDLRWGIESMFSDFKSIGFDITITKLIHEDRIEMLLLVVSIALYCSVSTGIQPLEKRIRVFLEIIKKKFLRSVSSYFKRGIKIIFKAILSAIKIPFLSGYLRYGYKSIRI